MYVCTYEREHATKHALTESWLCKWYCVFWTYLINELSSCACKLTSCPLHKGMCLFVEDNSNCFPNVLDIAGTLVKSVKQTYRHIVSVYTSPVCVSHSLSNVSSCCD